VVVVVGTGTVVGGLVVGVGVVVVTVVGTAPALATCVTRQSSCSRLRLRGLPDGSEGFAGVQSKSLGLMNAPGVQSNRTCSNGPDAIGSVTVYRLYRSSSVPSLFVSLSTKKAAFFPVRSVARSSTEGSSSEPGMLTPARLYPRFTSRPAMRTCFSLNTSDTTAV